MPTAMMKEVKSCRSLSPFPRFAKYAPMLPCAHHFYQRTLFCAWFPSAEGVWGSQRLRALRAGIRLRGGSVVRSFRRQGVVANHNSGWQGQAWGRVLRL